MQNLDKQGHIELFYGDESGFCLNPVIPYGWQFLGEQVSILPAKSKRLNILGFINQANELHTFGTENTINSEFVIDSIQQWLIKRQNKNTPKITVLVLDNARIHRSELFKKQIEIWQEKNLFIFFLPPYSPHLNKIEILWRKTKYEWIRPENYASFKILKKAVLAIFDQFGEKYKINFKL